MEPLDYWRLCDELTIHQAALLIAGVDPASYTHILSLQPDERPAGFDAAKTAITNAVRSKLIEGQIIELIEFGSLPDLGAKVPGSIDPAVSRVQVNSLRAWLRSRGRNSGFFFPESDSAPDYLNKNHPRYAPKLAAAVQAWQAVTSKAGNSGRSPKQGLMNWLRENAATLGLTDEAGVIRKQTLEEIAKIANWQLTGGAPKTPGS